MVLFEARLLLNITPRTTEQFKKGARGGGVVIFLSDPGTSLHTFLFLLYVKTKNRFIRAKNGEQRFVVFCFREDTVIFLYVIGVVFKGTALSGFFLYF